MCACVFERERENVTGSRWSVSVDPQINSSKPAGNGGKSTGFFQCVYGLIQFMGKRTKHPHKHTLVVL